MSPGSSTTSRPRYLEQNNLDLCFKGAYVGAVDEMTCGVCVSVTERVKW